MRRIEARADKLGECPTWDERSGRLLRIDVIGRRLLSCGFDGGQPEAVSLAEIPGSFALRRMAGCSWPIGAGSRYGTSPETRRESSCLRNGTAAANASTMVPAMRSDDFGSGKMDRRLRDTVGALYRVDPDLTVHRIASGFGLSNGIAWSPDNKTMYHCELAAARHLRLRIRPRRGRGPEPPNSGRLYSAMGMPDGCATDTEGFIWVAAPGASRVMRFDPDGKLERSVRTTAAMPTSVTFGGAGLRTLLITSMQPDEAPPREADGAVFAWEAPVAGMPGRRFAA